MNQLIAPGAQKNVGKDQPGGRGPYLSNCPLPPGEGGRRPGEGVAVLRIFFVSDDTGTFLNSFHSSPAVFFNIPV